MYVCFKKMPAKYSGFPKPWTSYVHKPIFPELHSVAYFVHYHKIISVCIAPFCFPFLVSDCDLEN